MTCVYFLFSLFVNHVLVSPHNPSIIQTLIPRETGWFGTYAANSDTTIVPLENQPFYVNDWIGLRWVFYLPPP